MIESKLTLNVNGSNKRTGENPLNSGTSTTAYSDVLEQNLRVKIVSVFLCQFQISIIFYLLDENFRGRDVVNANSNVIGTKIAIRFVHDNDFFVK